MSYRIGNGNCMSPKKAVKEEAFNVIKLSVDRQKYTSVFSISMTGCDCFPLRAKVTGSHLTAIGCLRAPPPLRQVFDC